DVDRPGGETWRGDVPLRTPFAHAALRGRTDVASALEELGAATAVDPGDAAVAALARGERASVPSDLDPDAQEGLILSALGGGLDAIVDELGPDFAGVVGGSPRGTLLHHAAWVGDAELVLRLLRRGADPCAGSGAEFDTPVAWAALGSEAYRVSGRDYVGVVE